VSGSSFFSLTPDRVLSAVEQAGHETTGLCYALNSLENRVYEVELEDRSRVVAKFYRPGRWSRETILDEHRLLLALAESEIPVCPPNRFPDGETLHATQEGIYFALFPRVGGRSPDDLSLEEYEQLGRLLGRIHNVSASLELKHRPIISPKTYGTDCLEIILAANVLPEGLRPRYTEAVRRLVDLGELRFKGAQSLVIHGDCHRGNLLRGRQGFFFLDFDDSGAAPPVQDLWLLLPARRAQCPQEVEAMLKGYEQFRPFDWRSLRLIEVLRGLRYVRYAAWIVSRWEDPSFPRAFPHFGTENYWQGQLTDIHEQLAILQEEQEAEYNWNS
jgi:Ser/Thr protein kinase RdoA (MazF antagonist)